MRANLIGCFLILATIISTASATTRYVDLNCPTPTPPYTNWSTAATNIQAAADAANGADLILVSDGVYASGAQLNSGMSNRLVLRRSGTIVQSLNGPERTIIQGWQVSGTTNGPGAIRCVCLDGNVVLSGFTLTHGATVSSQDGGGIWAGNSMALVTNCVITGNSASRYGGGVFGPCKVQDCLLTGNSALYGGGAYSSASEMWLLNSRVIGNTAESGGGVYEVDTQGSLLSDNWGDTGGGAWGGRLVNCTVIHNLGRIGGGTSGSTLINSIVYFNRASPAAANYDAGTLDHCCTTPLPLSGAGNLSVDPQLASPSHLSASSPCRSAGNDDWAMANLRDIDGEVLQHPPSIGCDEYSVGAVTGALKVAISAAYTNVAAGFGVEFASVIDGRTSASVWRFGNDATVSNSPCVQHTWDTAGDYVVTLTAYNETHPEGVDASLTMHIQTTPTHFVMLGSTNPVAPYETWETAAGDIQSAVDAASVPGALVIVADGIYDTGGRAVDGLMTNRVTVGKPLTLKSVNGPAVTRIVGYQVPGSTNGDGAIRCVYLSAGAALSGFTLTNGATRQSGDMEREQKGGAVWCPSISEVVTNCVLTRNSAYQRAGGAWWGTLNHCKLSDNTTSSYGGGAYGSVLTGCILTGNSAVLYGGAVAYGLLINCTLTGNSAANGSGAWNGWLYNCIAYSNASPSGAVGNYKGLMPNFCCTTPLPSGGTGNFTNAPLFVDAAARDFHLHPNSPCINAGANAYVATATDFDGKPRIDGGTVDAGAYEFEKPLSSISYAWLQSYGLPTDGTADSMDSDSDAMNNWQEWIAGTDPVNPASALRLLSPIANPPTVTLTWQSVSNRTYSVESAVNSTGQVCFTSIASNIPGRSGTTSFTDTNASGPGSVLYRVAVQRP